MTVFVLRSAKCADVVPERPAVDIRDITTSRQSSIVVWAFRGSEFSMTIAGIVGSLGVEESCRTDCVHHRLTNFACSALDGHLLANDAGKAAVGVSKSKGVSAA